MTRNDVPRTILGYICNELICFIFLYGHIRNSFVCTLYNRIVIIMLLLIIVCTLYYLHCSDDICNDDLEDNTT
jgi:hypothetical protein